MDSTYLTNRLHQRLAGRTTWLLACLAALAGFAIISLANVPAAAAVDVAGSVQSGACLQPPPIGSTPTTTTTDCPGGDGSGLQSVITTALNILTWITGVAAVFVLIIAGFRYVVSGGSSSGVTGAKNMIIYALIGVVVALLAQLIVRFVIGNVGDAAKETNSSSNSSQNGSSTPGTCTDSGGNVTCVDADGNSYSYPGDTPPCSPGSEGESCEFDI